MTPSDSRASILNRIKLALNTQSDNARKTRCVEEYHAIPRTYLQTGKLSQADRIALFDQRIRHYNATTFYSQGDIVSDIARILTAREKRSLIIPPGFPAEWLPRNFMFFADDGLTNHQLSLSDGVVTMCTLGIAITGTIVLESSAAQGRRAITLIPDYHLCLLRREDIVELVPEAIRALAPIKNRPLTFCSGPSATLDIEMTRVRGVHGPRTLDVLIL